MFPMFLNFLPGSYISLFIISKIGATFMTALASKIHFNKNKFTLKLLLVLSVSGLAGTALGTYFLQFKFDEILFKRLLFVFIVVTVIYLFFDKKIGVLNKEEERKFSPKLFFLTFLGCFSINILNGIFGGTGLFITILLVFLWKMNFIKAVGYTMAAYTIIGLPHVIYLSTIESFDYLLTVFVVVGALLGGFLGTHLQYIKGNLWVKRAAISMMFLLGIKMLF